MHRRDDSSVWPVFSGYTPAYASGLNEDNIWKINQLGKEIAKKNLCKYTHIYIHVHIGIHVNIHAYSYVNILIIV